MARSAEPQFARFTAAEVLCAVRSGRIRYPHPSMPTASVTAQILDGLNRGFPQRPLILWRDPDLEPDSPVWLIDGGDVVDVLLRVSGDLPEGAAEPVYLDTDTGEIVSWGQRPSAHHVTVRAAAVTAAADLDAFIAVERLTGERAERVRSFARSVREHELTAEFVDIDRSELPRLLQHLRDRVPWTRRAGIGLADLEPTTSAESRVPGWDSTPSGLTFMAGDGSGIEVPPDARWSALLAAEGIDPARLRHQIGGDDFADGGRSAVRAVREAAFTLRVIVGYPNGALLPETDTLPVLARFLRVFPRVDESVWVLLRRWVWRIALSDGGLAHLDLDAAIRGDALGGAVRLLEATAVPSLSPPGRTTIDPEGRWGRLVLLGMASLHPRDLVTGVLTNIETERPVQILRNRLPEAANLMLGGFSRGIGTTTPGRRTLRQAIEQARDPELLASHGIDAHAADLLRRGDEDGFLAGRSTVLDQAIVAFWTSMIEPGAADRRPVAALFQDAGDGDD